LRGRATRRADTAPRRRVRRAARAGPALLCPRRVARARPGASGRGHLHSVGERWGEKVQGNRQPFARQMHAEKRDGTRGTTGNGVTQTGKGRAGARGRRRPEGRSIAQPARVERGGTVRGGRTPIGGLAARAPVERSAGMTRRDRGAVSRARRRIGADRTAPGRQARDSPKGSYVPMSLGGSLRSGGHDPGASDRPALPFTRRRSPGGESGDAGQHVEAPPSIWSTFGMKGLDSASIELVIRRRKADRPADAGDRRRQQARRETRGERAPLTKGWRSARGGGGFLDSSSPPGGRPRPARPVGPGWRGPRRRRRRSGSTPRTCGSW
jgi:hypothetical protein